MADTYVRIGGSPEHVVVDRATRVPLSNAPVKIVNADTGEIVTDLRTVDNVAVTELTSAPGTGRVYGLIPADVYQFSFRVTDSLGDTGEDNQDWGPLTSPTAAAAGAKALPLIKAAADDAATARAQATAAAGSAADARLKSDEAAVRATTAVQQAKEIGDLRVPLTALGARSTATLKGVATLTTEGRLEDTQAPRAVLDRLDDIEANLGSVGSGRGDATWTFDRNDPAAPGLNAGDKGMVVPIDAPALFNTGPLVELDSAAAAPTVCTLDVYAPGASGWAPMWTGDAKPTVPGDNATTFVRGPAPTVQGVPAGSLIRASLDTPPPAPTGGSTPAGIKSRLVGTATITAATDRFAITGHGLAAGALVALSSITGATGVTNTRRYWVINPTTTDFQLSARRGGAAVDITTDGTATVTALAVNAGNSAAGAASTATPVLPAGFTYGTDDVVILITDDQAPTVSPNGAGWVQFVDQPSDPATVQNRLAAFWQKWSSGINLGVTFSGGTPSTWTVAVISGAATVNPFATTPASRTEGNAAANTDGSITSPPIASAPAADFGLIFAGARYNPTDDNWLLGLSGGPSGIIELTNEVTTRGSGNTDVGMAVWLVPGVTAGTAIAASTITTTGGTTGGQNVAMGAAIALFKRAPVTGGANSVSFTISWGYV